MTVSRDSVVLRVMTQLVRRATCHRCQLVAHRRLVRDLRHPHVVRALVVHLAHPRDEGVEHGRRLHAVVAVLEVDVVRLQAVLAANRQPEVLFLGEPFNGKLGVLRPESFAEQQGQAGAAGRAEEFALVHAEKMPVAGKQVQTLVENKRGPEPRYGCAHRLAVHVERHAFDRPIPLDVAQRPGVRAHAGGAAN